jgi:hypothetical protein
MLHASYIHLICDQLSEWKAGSTGSEYKRVLVEIEQYLLRGEVSDVDVGLYTNVL